MGMNQTPASERVHIGLFGRRNAGKIKRDQRSHPPGRGNRVGNPGDDDGSGL